MNPELTSLLYRAAWAGAATLPEAPLRATLNRACDLIVDRAGPSVRQLAKNQRRILGSGLTPAGLHDAVRAAMRSYGRYWLETFRLHRQDPDEIANRALAGTVGLHHIRAARDAGRGMILALPHSGNWDIAGLSMVHLLGGITTVAERIEPDSLYRRFVQYRERLGFEVLPLTGTSATPPRTAAILTERLRRGGMVCLLADRDLSDNGVPVTFFGEQTTMPAGPAMLAVRTGAALLPVHLSYSATGWIQRVDPAVEPSGRRLADKVRHGTQALADAFAGHIARAPTDWHMLQPFWTADRARRGVA